MGAPGAIVGLILGAARGRPVAWGLRLFPRLAVGAPARSAFLVPRERSQQPARLTRVRYWCCCQYWAFRGADPHDDEAAVPQVTQEDLPAWIRESLFTGPDAAGAW